MGTEVIDCIKKYNSSVTPVFEGVIVKMSATVSAEDFGFVLCVREFLYAWQCQLQSM